MPTYTYRCGECGPFDVLAPMRASSDERHCPTCGAGAGRVITAPGIRLAAPALRHALDAGERSRDEPTVTTTVPPRDRPTAVSRDPRHSRLPRP